MTIRTIENDPESPFGPPEVPAAEWTYRYVCEQNYKKGYQFVRAWLDRAGASEVPKFPKGMSLERTVEARVDHGRWLWDCPRCNAAQCCTPDDPRAFCCDCLNGGDGYYPVVFPAERAAIETLLNVRLEQFRNWTPGETVGQLQAENIAHGLPSKVDGYEWPGAEEATGLARAWRDARAVEEGERRRELAERAGR